MKTENCMSDFSLCFHFNPFWSLLERARERDRKRERKRERGERGGREKERERGGGGGGGILSGFVFFDIFLTYL